MLAPTSPALSFSMKSGELARTTPPTLALRIFSAGTPAKTRSSPPAKPPSGTNSPSFCSGRLLRRALFSSILIWDYRDFPTPPSLSSSQPSASSRSAAAPQSARPRHNLAPHTSVLPSTSPPSQIAGTRAHKPHPRRFSGSSSQSRVSSIPDARKTPESSPHLSPDPAWHCPDKVRGRCRRASCACSTRRRLPELFHQSRETPPPRNKSHPRSVVYPRRTLSPTQHPIAPRNNHPAATPAPTGQSTPATRESPPSSP